MEISKAHIVYSTAGHDKGALYFVIHVEASHVLLVDGKKRKLERPKRKNKKHVRFAHCSEHPVACRLRSGAPVEDKELRMVLAAYRCESQQNQRGANTLGQR